MTVAELIEELQDLNMPGATVDAQVVECQEPGDSRVVGIARILHVAEGPNKGAWVTLELEA